jgi:hypothetical protein
MTTDRKVGEETLLRILVRSRPNVISAHECNTNKPAELDSVWPLQFHKAGIGFAALRVVNCPVLPASVAFLRKARYEDKPDDRMVTFLWIRIVNIGLLFSVSRLRLAQSHDPGTQFAFTFEHLKGRVFALPEANRGCRIGCMNCDRSKPAGDQHQAQIGKSGGIHRFVPRSQIGRAVPDYSDESLAGCRFQSRASSNLRSREDRITNVTSLVPIDQFL